jgi:hypothetical protein
MCFNQECLSFDELEKAGQIKKCKENCNGNGICNNLGQCHCDAGYAPPDCYYPGLGGSIDSGPMRKPDTGKRY